MASEITSTFKRLSFICSICNLPLNDPIALDRIRKDHRNGHPLVIYCDNCHWGTRVLPVPYRCLAIEPWQVLEAIKGS